MKNYFHKEFLLFLCILSIIISPYKTSANQSGQDLQILLLFYKEEDLVITPTRHSKAISQVAENITVITSEELEMINAHTLTDALNNIPGIQMDIKGGPGSGAIAFIQGSEFRHVLVMIDGIAVNNLSNNFADIGAIPIQNIERVEIIKGPASSSWGSSLGGIIHIITKSSGDSEGIQGIYSAFYGEKNTADYRAEVSGKVKDSGHYLYAGNLSSDGLAEGTPYDQDGLYSKLSWNIADRSSLLFTFGYNRGSRGNAIYSGDIIYGDPNIGLVSDEDDFKYLFSTLTFKHSINHDAEFKLSLRSSSKNLDRINYQISTGAELIRSIIDDSSYGGSIDLAWRHGIHNIVFGFDVENGKLESANIIGGKQYLKKWAIFSNNTIKINRFSLTPGIRYDYTNTNGDQVSPSFGLTYRMTERNLFRGYIARGFHIPPLSDTFGTYPGYYYLANPDLKVEKIWSIQAGIESTALKYLWIKTTLFHHNIWDGIIDEEMTDPNGLPKSKPINKERQKRQGIEVEIKTVPVYDTSLFAGFSFIDSKYKDPDKEPIDIPFPIYTYDIGISYYNNKSFWAYLKGHYICWNADNQALNTQDRIFIWDINLMKRIHWDKKVTIKTFLTIHNIFNGSQYVFSEYKNPRRWIEAGLKSKF